MEYLNLIADNQIQIVTERYNPVVGEYKRGDLVEYDSLTKKIQPCTAVANVFGIIAEDVNGTEVGVQALVYLAGCFSLKAINKAVGIADDELKIEARKLAIYIK